MVGQLHDHIHWQHQSKSTINDMGYNHMPNHDNINS